PRSSPRNGSVEQEYRVPGGSGAPGDGTAPGAATARRGWAVAGAAARFRAGRRDSVRGGARDGAAAAVVGGGDGRSAGAAAGRFFEIPYCLQFPCGTARASLSESCPISRPALAGTDVPATGSS